jgi:anti-sigma factor RsiW
VLDQLSDTDSELQPKSTAPSGGVKDSIRHLAQEELEAYLDGRLAPARLQHCGAHLDACEACRAELEDVRTFRSELPGLPRSEPYRHGSQGRKRRRGLALPLTAAAATIFVVAASASFWWWHSRPRTDKPLVAATVTPPLAGAPVTPAVAVANSPVAGAVATPPVTAPVTNRPATGPLASRPAIAAVAASPQPTAPVTNSRATAALTSRPQPQPANVRPAPETNTTFALLSPLGETIADQRPEFHWQPLPGAVRYSVAIVDERLHSVQRSRALRTTDWRPRRPLRRGQTYFWQVTATLRGGSKVVASTQGALLRIAPHQSNAP